MSDPPRVLSAVTGDLESDFVTAVHRLGGITLARRCADLPDLLAAAAAGLGDVAAVGAGLRRLDRDSVTVLTRSGVRVVGVLAATDDEDAERVLRQVGVDTVARVDAPGEQLRAALSPPAVKTEEGSWWAPGATGPPAGPHTRDGSPSTDPGSPAAGAAPSGPGAAIPVGTADARGRSGDPAPPGRPGRGDTDGPPASPDGTVEREPGKVVAVWGPTGAPGRTTVAVNLAAEFAAAGRQTLLVDADTWGASIAQHLALLDEAPGLAAAARASEQGRLDAAFLAARAPYVSDSLRVLTGLPRADRWSEVRSAAMAHILDVARLLSTLVVVDCGFSLEDDEELSYDTQAPRRNAVTLTTLGEADEIVVVGGGEPVGLQRLVRAVQDLAEVSGLDPVVVVNRVRASAVGARPEVAIGDVLARFAGLSEPILVPDARDDLDRAMLAGAALVEAVPQSPARVAIRAVASRLDPTVAARSDRRRGRRRSLSRR